MPTLLFAQGDRTLLSWRLRGGRTLIGRSDRCDVSLPSEAISRTHCVIDESDGWWLVDRSRHGTFVDGARIRRAALTPGMSFHIGEWTVTMVADEAHGATVTQMVSAADFEELVEIGPDAVAARRAVIEVLDGPRKGQRVELERASLTLGGDGADVVVDPGLPAEAARLRVVRGRVMIEPRERPVYLDSQRIRELTPVWDGESLRVGDVTFEVRAEIRSQARRQPGGFGELVGSAPCMSRTFDLLDRMARHDAPVLLLGESGTGKELAARGLHDHGRRADGPFVAINCAAIPANLVESQLFGHEKGSFTGAESRRDGAFQRAHNGTLFLDELGEMTLDAQARLLRTLESGEVLRVGGAAPEHPDVRLIAATNRDPTRMAAEGRLRQDLFHRLAVLAVRMPALREHPEDLPQLVHSLLLRNHPGATITERALDLLARHDWPGNVRELRNVLTRAVVLGGERIDAAFIQLAPWGIEPEIPLAADVGHEAEERAAIVEALRLAGGNRTKAALAMGIPRTSLSYRMMRLGIEV